MCRVRGSVCRCPRCGCTTPARTAVPFQRVRSWRERPHPSGCLVRHGDGRDVRSHPSPAGGRVRALQAILRPRIPPDHPKNAENCRESGFPGSTRAKGHPVGPRLAYGRILAPSPVTTKLPAGRSIEDHVGRSVGHDGAALGRGDGVRGVEHTAASSNPSPSAHPPRSGHRPGPAGSRSENSDRASVAFLRSSVEPEEGDPGFDHR